MGQAVQPGVHEAAGPGTGHSAHSFFPNIIFNLKILDLFLGRATGWWDLSFLTRGWNHPLAVESSEF